jgi:hypothetical protein
MERDNIFRWKGQNYEPGSSRGLFGASNQIGQRARIQLSISKGYSLNAPRQYANLQDRSLHLWPNPLTELCWRPLVARSLRFGSQNSCPHIARYCHRSFGTQDLCNEKECGRPQVESILRKWPTGKEINTRIGNRDVAMWYIFLIRQMPRQFGERRMRRVQNL